MSRTSTANRSASAFRPELERLERRDTPGSLIGGMSGRLSALPANRTTTSSTGGLELVALPASVAPSADARPLAVAAPAQSQASSPAGLGVGTVSGVAGGSGLNDPLLNVAFPSGPVASGVFVGAAAQAQPRAVAAEAGQLLAPLPASQFGARPAGSSDLAGVSVSTPVFTGVDLGAPAPAGAAPTAQYPGAPTYLYPGFTVKGSSASYQTSGPQFSNYAAHPVPAIVVAGKPMIGTSTGQPKPPTYATVGVSSGELLRGIANAGGFDVLHGPSFTFSGLPSEITAQIARELWFANPATDYAGSVTLSVTSDDYNFDTSNGRVNNTGATTRTVTWQETPYDDGTWLRRGRTR